MTSSGGFLFRLSTTDPVDAARLPFGGTWNGIVGVLDVDPTSRTKHSVSTANGGDDATGTMQTTATAAQINAALVAAPANTYVELASGVFTVGADLTFNTDSKTLRGQLDGNGQPSTTLRFSSAANHLYMRKVSWDFDNPGAFTNIAISSGHTRGSTSVVVASTPTGLTSGRLLWITAPKNAPTIDGGGWTNWFGSTDAHPFSQAVKVTNVNGTTITFTPAINADYISGLSCKVHYRTAASQVDYCGLENCIVECGTATYFTDNIVEFTGANQCWMKNCKLLRLGGASSLRAMLYIYGGYNCEMSHCNLRQCNDNGSSSMYHMSSLHCSGLLITNNILTDVANNYPILATSGSAFVYNYCFDNGYGAFQSQWVFHHGSHNHFNLFEGNWLAGQHASDETATGNQSHSRNSLYFRERVVGKDTAGGSTTNLNCILFFDHHDNVTVAGCVLGTSGVQSYSGGGGNNTGEGIGYCFNLDTTSTATLAKYKNYNTADAGVHSGEGLSAGQALVNSYVYTSKPAFFGSCPWPWCEPTNFSQSNTVTNLPAGYRETNGTDP